MFIRIQLPWPYTTPLIIAAEQVTEHFAIYPAIDFDEESGGPQFRGGGWVVRQLPTGRQMTISHEYFRDDIAIRVDRVDLNRVRDFLDWLETRADWSAVVRHRDVDEVTWQAISSMVGSANDWRRPATVVAA